MSPPAKRTGALPAFQQPTPPTLAEGPEPTTLDQPTQMDRVDPTMTPHRRPVDSPGSGIDGASGALPRDLPVPRLVPLGRTDTSDTPDPLEVKEVVRLSIALVGIGLTIAGLVIMRVRERKLRRPTDKQVRDFAEPLTNIALRHFDIAALNKDLTDGIRAAGAVGAYVEDGPLTRPYVPDPGLPATPPEEDD